MTGYRKISNIAIAVGVISLVLTIALLVPYYALQNLWIILLFVIVASGGIVGIILGRRSRRDGIASGRAANWGAAVSVTALLINVVLLIVFVIGIWPPAMNRVQLEGTGTQAGITASFASDTSARTLEWPSVGTAQYSTVRSSTWITITAPDDSADQTVGCKIYWNDELVVEETSDSGTVICEYHTD